MALDRAWRMDTGGDPTERGPAPLRPPFGRFLVTRSHHSPLSHGALASCLCIRLPGAAHN
ncbi:hypothetical protein WOLCODRAFT_26467 [Wolfiporia cocos MD-104 SS10]|uniref:Uncharacterized protein n=1 Tax=Wolfiporia cocos (strain MD-104) TaxID=742152 RepID=A0A2H3JQ57_WOLCO|nr:hypothetical protein WOLCODRAFT_26467 [Wolfiporia cocos MD-104 SS10]